MQGRGREDSRIVLELGSILQEMSGAPYYNDNTLETTGGRPWKENGGMRK